MSQNQQLTIDQFYQELRAGKLFGLKCESGHVTVPPSKSCRICHSFNLKMVELSKEGEIASFTQVYVKTKDFPVNTPYILALVRLKEGGNLLGVLGGAKSEILLGSKVLVRAVDVVDNQKWPRIFFDLV